MSDFQQPGLFDSTWFEEYHAQNPHIYEAFKRFTLEATANGRTRLSARMVVERLRWESMVRAVDGEYKINDHIIPFYARLFVQDFPEHKNLFSMRKAKADQELGLQN